MSPELTPESRFKFCSSVERDYGGILPTTWARVKAGCVGCCLGSYGDSHPLSSLSPGVRPSTWGEEAEARCLCWCHQDGGWVMGEAGCLPRGWALGTLIRILEPRF